MVPTDLPQSTMLSALDRASIAYFDVRLHETALVIAKEVSMHLFSFRMVSRHRCCLNPCLYLILDFSLVQQKQSVICMSVRLVIVISSPCLRFSHDSLFLSTKRKYATQPTCSFPSLLVAFIQSRQVGRRYLF